MPEPDLTLLGDRTGPDVFERFLEDVRLAALSAGVPEDLAAHLAKVLPEERPPEESVPHALCTAYLVAATGTDDRVLEVRELLPRLVARWDEIAWTVTRFTD